MLCRLLGVRIRIIGEVSHQRPLLVACNHVSWLDIPVISAVAPVSFIAKSEVSQWPLVGWLAKLQRSVFVVRQKRTQTRAVANHIASRLDRGDAMVLFPEGTTGDGNRLRPFRSALVGAAETLVANGHEAERVKVQPMALAYTHINGLPLGRQHRPLVAWDGDVTLGAHVIALLRAGLVDVTVSIGEPVAFADAADRKHLTRVLERAVGQLFSEALHGEPAPGSEPSPPRAALARGAGAAR